MRAFLLQSEPQEQGKKLLGFLHVDQSLSNPLWDNLFPFMCHDVGGRTLMSQFFAHEVHVGGDMREELVITSTQIVQVRLAVAIPYETVLGTLPMAGKEETTLLALAG